MSKLTYLACPFSHPEEAVRFERIKKVDKFAAYLMHRMDRVVFSPITHSSRIAKYLPESYLLNVDFWMKQDIPILLKCDELAVFCLDGWRESKGIKKEIEIAKYVGMRILYWREGKVSYRWDDLDGGNNVR